MATLAENKLWAIADSGDAVVEFDESNNQMATALKLLPDLTVMAAGIVGRAEVVSITVHNIGFAEATDVKLWLKEGDDLPSVDNFDHALTIPSIAAGRAVTVTVKMPTGKATYAVKVDPDNAIPEISESNNAAVRRLTISVAERRLYLPVVSR